MSDAAAPQELSGRIPELDGLRGMAIGMVLVFHYFQGTWVTRPGSLPAYLLSTVRLTWSGVDLFFVLSGFLIGGILLDARTSTNYFRVFYTRRFFRIFPVYAAVLLAFPALVAAAQRIHSGGFTWLVRDGPPWYACWTFTQNIWMALAGTLGGNGLAMTWSLAVEEQFYLTLPLLVRHDDASSPWYLLVREYMGDVSGLGVLEVACGRGGLVSALARGGARVTGCDFSSSALQAARTKVNASGAPTQAALIQGDAQNLPFADDSFDVVVSCETIEHLPAVESAIQGMHRVTRPGGKLFLTTPNYANFMGLYEVYARFRHPSRKNDQPFDRRQWFPQILGWVRRAGWTILRTDGTVHQFPFFPGRNPVRWESLESNRTVRRLFSPLAYTYFVMAQKKGD